MKSKKEPIQNALLDICVYRPGITTANFIRQYLYILITIADLVLRERFEHETKDTVDKADTTKDDKTSFPIIGIE